MPAAAPDRCAMWLTPAMPPVEAVRISETTRPKTCVTEPKPYVSGAHRYGRAGEAIGSMGSIAISQHEIAEHCHLHKLSPVKIAPA